MKKLFAVPSGVTSNETVIEILTDLYSTRRDLFRKDSEISCIYDSFSGIWTGGRAIAQSNQDFDFIRDTINKFNNRGIPFRQIFSNLFINDFLEDERCNKIMQILSENKMNSVTISSDLALKIFKQRYPDLQYSSSVTKMYLDLPSFIEELEKDYDDVCLWHKFNNKKNWDIIPEHLRHKVSILVCQNCNPNCNYSYLCHLKFSMRTLEQYGERIHEPFYHIKCQWSTPKDAEDLLTQPITLHHEDLDELVKMGYNHFKITGRCGPISHLEMLKVFMYYLVDPDKYQEFTDIFKEKFEPLSEEHKKVKVRVFNISAARVMLDLVDNTISLPAEKILKDTHFDVDEILYKNILKDLKATEIQKNLVYITNKAIAVVAITKHNSNFEKQKNFYEEIKLKKKVDDYTIATQSSNENVIPEGTLDTNYGTMNFLYLEPRELYTPKCEFRTVLWNDDIIYNIMLENQTYTSHFVGYNKLKVILDYLSQYIDYTSIDVEWLNYAIVKEVGQGE